MVLTARGWGTRRELCHRQHDEEHQAAHHEDQPNTAGSSSVREIENQRSQRKLPGQTEHNDETNNGKESESALQLLLLAQSSHIPLVVPGIVIPRVDLLDFTIRIINVHISGFECLALRKLFLHL